MRILAAVVMVSVGVLAQPSDSDTPVALVVTYTDGRAVSYVLGSRPARSWTPLFPRILDWRPPEGMLPIAALQIAATREGRDIRVKLSVLLGQPHQEERPVAEVLVTAGEPVVVEELRDFGIEPVRLSHAPVGPLVLHPPVLASKAASLDISLAELVTDAPPRYRIAVRNRAPHAVLAFSVDSTRNGRPALSGRQYDLRNAPIIAPGETYEFTFGLGSTLQKTDAPVSPEPVESITITAALFDDLSLEGDQRALTSHLVLDVARRAQLTRIVPLFAKPPRGRDAARTLEALRAAVKALPIDPDESTTTAAQRYAAGTLPPSEVQSLIRLGLQFTKDQVLKDLQQLEADAPGTAEALDALLKSSRTAYVEWLARLASR